VLIRASWNQSDVSSRVLERLVAVIEYHQKNIADSKRSHTKSGEGRLRQRGVALEKISCCHHT